METIPTKDQTEDFDSSFQIMLNSNIDINKIKNSLEQKLKCRPAHKKFYEEDQELVYSILHKHSNYDEVIWSLYGNTNRKFIHKQLKLALIEISKLDTSLTWACMKIFKRYKSQFDLRKKRSSYIASNLNM